MPVLPERRTNAFVCSVTVGGVLTIVRTPLSDIPSVFDCLFSTAGASCLYFCGRRRRNNCRFRTPSGARPRERSGRPVSVRILDRNFDVDDKLVDGDGDEGTEVLARLIAADEEPRGDIRDAQRRADVFHHIADDLGALPQSPFKGLFKKSPLKILKIFPPRAGFRNESRPWGKFLKVLRNDSCKATVSSEALLLSKKFPK